MTTEKEHFIKSLPLIKKCKRAVTNKDDHYFNLTITKKLDDPEISIVMTTSNRSQQTYFTLKTISKSKFSNKVQVIIVDDSTCDNIEINRLHKYNLCIYHIKIQNKFWINPCINYNFGFQFVTAPKIIIQNGEVCHIGDVLSYIDQFLKDNEYFVFDVGGLRNIRCNNKLYNLSQLKTDSSIYEPLMRKWYQHSTKNNRNFHFLTAITKKTMNLLNGFDYDFSFGIDFDDSEFIYRIEKLNIKIIQVPNESGIFGIHQWHKNAYETWGNNVVRNKQLYYSKKKYSIENNEYIFLCNIHKDSVRQMIDILFDNLTTKDMLPINKYDGCTQKGEI